MAAPDYPYNHGGSDRRLDELELRLRRSASLHGIYAAIGLLVGLLLPVAQVRFNQADVPERYSVLGLLFALNSDYEVDHPTLVVLSAAALAVSAIVAIVAFLVAARAQTRTAATVALVVSILLPVAVVAANFVFGITDIDSGSSDDPLEGWAVGCWVLIIGGLAGCWIASTVRAQFDY